MWDKKNKSAIQIIIFIICFFIIWSARATYFYSIDESINPEYLRVVYSTFLKLALWVLPAYLFVLWFRQKPPLRYLGLVSTTKRQWMVSIVSTALFLGIIIGYELILGNKTLTAVRLGSIFSISGILFHFVSPLLEEVLFRGLFLHELSKILSKLYSNVITSILFVGIHLPYGLSSGIGLEKLLILSIGIFIFSMFAGWLYQKSYSIWPAALAHIMNNIISIMLVLN
jgi:CAAX protease family protein